MFECRRRVLDAKGRRMRAVERKLHAEYIDKGMALQNHHGGEKTIGTTLPGERVYCINVL